MSVPSNPSMSDIVTEGLKRGGRVTPSAGDITYASSILFQEVKADLHLKAPRHSSLLTQSIQYVTPGVSRYFLPDRCETMRSIQLIDAPDVGNYKATAVSGSSATITLANIDLATNDMIGRVIYLTSGAGSGQYGQVKDWNNSTKLATLDTWRTQDETYTAAASNSVYFVEAGRRKLYSYDKPTEFDVISAPFARSTPTQAFISGREIILDYAPDTSYVLLYDYWYALDRLEEAGAVLGNHMRKFRNVWTQGIAVKVMQRYDEDRYGSEIGIYNAMLDMYGSEASSVGQVTFRDVG